MALELAPIDCTDLDLDSSECIDGRGEVVAICGTFLCGQRLCGEHEWKFYKPIRPGDIETIDLQPAGCA